MPYAIERLESSPVIRILRSLRNPMVCSMLSRSTRHRECAPRLLPVAAVFIDAFIGARWPCLVGAHCRSMTPQASQPFRTPNSGRGSGSRPLWTTTEWPTMSSGLPSPTVIPRRSATTLAFPSVPAKSSGRLPLRVLPGAAPTSAHTLPALAAFGELQLPTSWIYMLCSPGVRSCMTAATTTLSPRCTNVTVPRTELLFFGDNLATAPGPLLGMMSAKLQLGVLVVLQLASTV